MKTDCCGNCRFWNGGGECVRYPPTVTTSYYQDHEGYTKREVDSDLPQTGESFWCGEWKGRSASA